MKTRAGSVCESACNWCPPDSVIGGDHSRVIYVRWSFGADDEAEDDDGGNDWTDQARIFRAAAIGAGDLAAAACIEEALSKGWPLIGELASRSG